MTRPGCSIIVPSYRAGPTIGGCLAALLAQDAPMPFEIVVVDSSDDGTAAVIRRTCPAVVLVHRRRRTDPAAARNIGARVARFDRLAFIDADCIAAPDWLRRLMAALDEGCDGVGGAIVNANADSSVSRAGYFCEFREFLPRGAARPARNLTLGNAAYRRPAWEAAGGFPEGFFPQEDQVFHERMQTAGFRLRLDPAIVVRHTHRSSPASFLAHQHRIGVANARVLRRIQGRGALFARRRWTALIGLSALVPLRFTRTLTACWSADPRGLLRHPTVAWLCWLGMCAWGRGFVEGARGLRHEL